MYEYDAGLALIHLEDAQRLYRLGERVSGVRLKLREMFDAPRVARELTRTLSADVLVLDWTRSHANFFRAVQIEKRVMFIILTLIVAVAAFNLVSSLVMTVTDKQADIAILRTLGATPGLDPEDLRDPGLAHRRGRHPDRRGHGRAHRAQHRNHRAGDRARLQRAVPGQGCLLHQRPAVRAATGRT